MGAEAVRVAVVAGARRAGNRLLQQQGQRDRGGAAGVAHGVDPLRRQVGVVAGRDIAAGAERDQEAAGGELRDVRATGDRVAGARREQRQAAVAERPAARRRAEEVELPEVAVEIAGVSVVGDAVAVDVDRPRCREAVRACRRAGAGVDLGDQGAVFGVDHEQERVAGRVADVVAAAHDHRPAAVVRLDQQRLAEHVAQVGILELPAHDVRGVGFVEPRRVGDVEREQALGTGAHAGDEQGVPGAVVEDIADRRRAVDEVAVRVGEVGQLGQVGDHRRRHVGEHLGAGDRVDRVQHAVVGAHVDDRRAGSIGGHERAVPRRLEVVVVAEVRRADVVRRRVDHVAERRDGAVPELRRGARRARAAARLVAGIAAQETQTLLAERVAAAARRLVERGRLGGVELGRTGRGRQRRPAERNPVQAGRGRRLVAQDRAAGVPVLHLDLRTGVPGRGRADRAAAGDGVVEQASRPVRAVELGLEQRRAGGPRAGVERDRRGGAGLGLDVADDVLERALQRIRAAADEGGGIAAAEQSHLVERGDRARVGERVAHADDVGLDVVVAARHAGRAQRRQLVEDVALGPAVGPDAGRVLRVHPFRRVVLVAVGATGRIAVGGQHHEVALAGLRDRRAAAAEVVAHAGEGARDRREEGVVLDLAGAVRRLVAQLGHQGREMARRVGTNRLVDSADAGGIVAVAPAAPDPDLARRRLGGRQEAGVGRREAPDAVVAVEVAPASAGVAGVAVVDVVIDAADADAVEHRVAGIRIQHVVDVGVVAAALVGDVGIAVGRLRVGDAAPARVRRRDAADAVVGEDHRRRVAEVVGVRVVERRTVGAEAAQAEVERIAVRRQQAAQDAPGDVAARVRVVAVDDLAAHRRVHRLRVVEDDHDVRLDRRRQEERKVREGEWRCRERGERHREEQRDDAAGVGGDRLHDDLR